MTKKKYKYVQVNRTRDPYELARRRRKRVPAVYKKVAVRPNVMRLKAKARKRKRGKQLSFFGLKAKDLNMYESGKD